SIARLNSANSRIRPSIWSLVRIDQTCLAESGGLAPMSFPLFQGVRISAGGLESSWICMVVLLPNVESDHGARQTGPHPFYARFWRYSGHGSRAVLIASGANDPKRTLAL